MNHDTWVEAALANPDLVDEIYSKYSKDPNSVDSSWHFAFSQAIPVKQTIAQSISSDQRIYDLIEAYRIYGHLQADINPIALDPIQEPIQLKLDHLGFQSNELSQLFPTFGLLPTATAPLQQIVDTLKSIYCGKIGIEYKSIENPELEEWLQQRIEPTRFKTELTIDQKKMVLQQLNHSELFETFIHTKYTGQKRFSLEGGETLIPMLEAVVETGNDLGVQEFVVGMAHRGRLNVLSNILRKSHADIFSEFEEGYIPNSFEGSGDVKYHKGFSSEVTLKSGQRIKIALAPNPSHLESVDPVVEGQTRAKQILRNDQTQKVVMPVLIHGDGAISGQGVLYETLQLYKLPGYATGGTLHFVINNQVGFTTTPEESRSTRYCTDIARAFSAPVFHVNAEDPEGCVYATNLAVEIRQKFHCDVFIELNCYRKYGHNEADEPAYTQPLEYQLIRKKRPIRELYRDQLIQEGTLEKDLAESLEKEFTQELQSALQESKQKVSATGKEERGQPDSVETIHTKVPQETLVAIAQRISTVPEGFTIHPKLNNLVQERLSMIQEGNKPIDWGMAELLAYGSILWDGKDVRLSGQDCRRGTFSHRHAVWVDQAKEQTYIPLSNLKEGQGRFDVINSPLSEYAVLGFEYGYSVANPRALVIWEAQFGDFCNTAQVVLDQYIATSEQKWGQKFSLVLLLPHGYEGQGPEHSSGRMERFLILAGEDNMRIVNPTTPAQFFHLLRRQILHPQLKPLVVFTPKGLLRHPECVSSLKDLSNGSFQEIIEDSLDKSKVEKLLLCSGRIYYDLLAEREKQKMQNCAIVRLEQLYPLDKEHLKKILQQYAGLQECLWVQEEPRNMGAWGFLHEQLQALLPKQMTLRYVGRERCASPAAGSYVLHKKQHADILNAIFKG
ncbi:MAG: 2-oxoglutarate dehydrogenase E1 component [Parachlamydiaceae bacterium]|nr:2-oxoglutarate dehydrogenase E1 component [Parachlamydiaceae bacterium]